MDDQTRFEEERLIAACRQGDTTAYGTLVRRYQDRLHHALYRFLQDTDDALDVVQEAFLSAYLALGDFKGGARFYTWLYRIAMNHAIDLRRRQASARRGGTVDAQARMPPDHRQGPDQTAMRRDTAEMLHRALGKLSPEHRLALILKDIEGMSYEEMAEVLAVPIGTVRSRLHRARLELKDILTQASPLLLEEGP
ncbi:MAG TPA: sigma-70 family RNA polymerase sigma factor [Gemmatales bacterium]|nr:sigma-70 family RNA polymerase sigma factor [Gemmatales bacterium]HMP58591.1 sigma-70 family RNA polymerase sigma factor [Gemmatales bacterium]